MKMHLHPKQVAADTLKRLEEARRKALAPPKFCKDCQWHSFKEIPKKDRFVFHHYCKYPPLLNPITGEPSNAATNRNNHTLCGPQALYFHPRAK